MTTEAFLLSCYTRKLAAEGKRSRLNPATENLPGTGQCTNVCGGASWIGASSGTTALDIFQTEWRLGLRTPSICVNTWVLTAVWPLNIAYWFRGLDSRADQQQYLKLIFLILLIRMQANKTDKFFLSFHALHSIHDGDQQRRLHTGSNYWSNWRDSSSIRVRHTIDSFSSILSHLFFPKLWSDILNNFVIPEAPKFRPKDRKLVAIGLNTTDMREYIHVAGAVGAIGVVRKFLVHQEAWCMGWVECSVARPLAVSAVHHRSLYTDVIPGHGRNIVR
jgi:hypothetical protein